MPMKYSGARRPSKSFDAASHQGLRLDTLGLAHILQTEALTTTSLLILSTCAVGCMLYFLREILIPFAIAIFFMYILQPIVNYLSKPPRRWCDKCCKKRGEQCCESFWSLTKSRQYSEVLDDGELEEGVIANCMDNNGGGDRGGGGGGGGGSSRIEKPTPSTSTKDKRQQQLQQHQHQQQHQQQQQQEYLFAHGGHASGGGGGEGVYHPHHVHGYPSASSSLSGVYPPGRRRPGCFLDRPLIPRWVAVVLAILFAFLVLVMVAVILYGSVMNLQEEIPKYERGAQEVGHVLKKWLAIFHYSLDDDLVPWVIYRVHHATPKFLSLVLATLTNGLYVLIFLIYLLVSPVRPIPNGVWGQIDLHIRRYIRLKTAVCMAAGSSVGVTLFLLRIPLAWVFGLVTFIFNFMPNIGPLFATLLPMPIAIFDPDISVTVKVLTFVLPTIVHMIIGNFVEPRVFGETFDLSPVVVLLSLAFWGSLWGIPGMVLSVPMMVMARIVCLHLQHPYASTVVAILEGKYFETFEKWDEATVATFRDRMSSWDATYAGLNDSSGGIPTTGTATGTTTTTTSTTATTTPKAGSDNATGRSRTAPSQQPPSSSYGAV